MGNMGNQVSSPERDVYDLMKGLLKKHGKNISCYDLKPMLKWVEVKIPTVTASSIFTCELWDDVGLKLWDAATSGNAEAQRMLPWWRSIFETLKAQEGELEDKERGEEPLPAETPTAPPFPPSGPSRLGPLGAYAAGYPAEEYPFNQDSVDLNKERDLYPPDPHDVWANIR